MAGNMPSQQPQGINRARLNARREEYRKYLEEGGVMEMLTRALTELLHEEVKPEEPVDYIKCYLAQHKRPESDLCIVRSELLFTRDRLMEAEGKVFELKQRLCKYEDVEGFTSPIPSTLSSNISPTSSANISPTPSANISPTPSANISPTPSSNDSPITSTTIEEN